MCVCVFDLGDRYRRALLEQRTPPSKSSLSLRVTLYYLIDADVRYYIDEVIRMTHPPAEPPDTINSVALSTCCSICSSSRIAAKHA